MLQEAANDNDQEITDTENVQANLDRDQII